MTLGLYVSHAHFLDAAHLFPDVVKPWVFGSPPHPLWRPKHPEHPFLSTCYGAIVCEHSYNPAT